MGLLWKSAIFEWSIFMNSSCSCLSAPTKSVPFSERISLTFPLDTKRRNVMMNDAFSRCTLIQHSKYSAILSKIHSYRLLFGDFAHWDLSLHLVHNERLLRGWIILTVFVISQSFGRMNSIEDLCRRPLTRRRPSVWMNGSNLMMLSLTSTFPLCWSREIVFLNLNCCSAAAIFLFVFSSSETSSGWMSLLGWLLVFMEYFFLDKRVLKTKRNVFDTVGVGDEQLEFLEFSWIFVKVAQHHVTTPRFVLVFRSLFSTDCRLLLPVLLLPSTPTVELIGFTREFQMTKALYRPFWVF